eukprot:COSAG04_NODE_1308_length_7288_cov_2.749339_8_plen_64_part_00
MRLRRLAVARRWPVQVLHKVQRQDENQLERHERVFSPDTAAIKCFRHSIEPPWIEPAARRSWS